MTTSAVSPSLEQHATDPVELIRAAFAAPGARGTLTVATLPAPLAPLEAFLDAAPGEDAVLWSPPEGARFAALGAAETLTGSGPERGERIRRLGESVFERVEQVTLGNEPAPPIRCFGGLSFQPGSAAHEPWKTFGDSRFVLPRFVYTREKDRAWLMVVQRPEEAGTDAARRLLVTASQLLGALAAASRTTGQRTEPLPRRVVSRGETSETEYRALVQGIVDRIAHGEFEKVVISRRTELSFDGPVSVTGVLRDLAEASAHCTRFAFRFGEVTFLGATPERLIRRSGLSIDTAALAGSSDAARGAELMHSPKEREEHELVVREIVRALSPLCTTLEYPAAPELRTLRHLLHLTTPIHGRLARPVHVLDLVVRLHPTPAVGGVPGAEAVRFITEHEHAERGWYASPIGWFDGMGDGEFAVGLRSGALVSDRAYLYAGGGIVRDSDPASEYEETRLKLAALSSALHVAQ